jgi:hypothetical protein
VGAVLPVTSRIKRFRVDNSDYKTDDLHLQNSLDGTEVTVRTELKNFTYEIGYE